MSEGTDLPGLSYRGVLRLPRVGHLVAASSFSRLAENMFALAVVLYVLGRFGSPLLAGVVGFAAVAPGLVLSPVAGAVLDRVGPARVILLDLVASAVVVAVLVATDRTGSTSGWLVVVLAALYSLTSPLHLAGIRTLLPRLVPAPALPRVNAIDTAVYALADVLGPALTGGLSALAGPVTALTVIAALYAAAALGILPLARTPDVRPGREPRSLAHDVLSGIQYLLRHPTLRTLAGSYSLYQFAWGVLVVAVPVTGYRIFGSEHAANVTSGLLWAGVGLLAGVGALIAGRLRVEDRERRLIGLGTLCTAVAIFPLAGLGGLLGLAAGLMLVGLFSGLVDVGTLTLRQRRTDPDRLGRVLAISISANLSGLPIGSLVAGLLVTRSLPLTYAAAAAAALLAAIVVTVTHDQPNLLRTKEVL